MDMTWAVAQISPMKLFTEDPTRGEETISQALRALLDELRSIKDTKAMNISCTISKAQPQQWSRPTSAQSSLVLHPLQNRWMPTQHSKPDGLSGEEPAALHVSSLVSPSPRPPKWLIRLMELPQWMSLARTSTRSLTCEQQTFELVIVVLQLDVDILAGNPFMVRKTLVFGPPNVRLRSLELRLSTTASPSKHTLQPNVWCTQYFLLRNPNRTVVLPGKYIQFSTPSDSDSDTLWPSSPGQTALQTCYAKQEMHGLPPQQIFSVDHVVCIRLPYPSEEW
ncbi:hypothetical protein OS493_039108 [Desmophyllum pertusum]|uniref:Uncharacterized protein n=1 Tax=Desmophyllum pertusum TaxID=174260 RepID=A0A9W9ZHW9_9CNID|nr:hypothetical protein OS493_039108 [Desmophyllum pertusum]